MKYIPEKEERKPDLHGLRKAVRMLDYLTDRILLLFCLTVFLLGFYALYDSYLVYLDASDTDVLRFRPGTEADSDTDQEITGHMAAWLTLSDSSIDCPVMQGEDNSEYLSKNPFGEYSLSGSIFLDFRNAPDFTDDYSLIYGHHMEHGRMFGALDDWLDPDYCDMHRMGELIVDETSYSLTVFAVVEAEATEEALFAPTEVSRDLTLSFIRTHARILYEEDIPTETDRIVALSTCKFPDTAERTIILCRIR